MQQEADAEGQERDPAKQFQRQIQVRLVFDHKAGKAAPAERLFLSEGKQGDTDVRVNFQLIGMSVMPVMLIDPPAPAPSQNQIAGDETCQFKQPRTAKNLPVADIMPDKADLGKGKGQKDRIQQLEPGVVENHKAGNAENQQAQRQKKLIRIVGRLRLQQTFLPDTLFQFSILVDRSTLGKHHELTPSADYFFWKTMRWWSMISRRKHSLSY